MISAELFILSLIGSRITELVIVFCFVFFVASFSKVLKRIARTVGTTSIFAVFIFVINFIITLQVYQSLLYSFRFVSVVSSTSLFFVTTSPDELEQVMRSLHFPRDFIFAFVTAVRFVPVIMLDAMQIMDAQKSRGLELEKGNFVRRIRNLIPVLIPLVVSSVVRSSELAEAMEARAYGAVKKPTVLYEYKLKIADKLVLVTGIIMFSIAVYSFYYLGFL